MGWMCNVDSFVVILVRSKNRFEAQQIIKILSYAITSSKNIFFYISSKYHLMLRFVAYPLYEI